MKSYKDVFGNVVLERRAGNYDTYYVYDNLNRLRFVLPPKYQNENRLDYYAYQYEYDGRGRISTKKLPGCNPVQYWYDSRDRLIKMQDGILAQAGRYRIWSYDALDRLISQGIQGTNGQNYDEVRNYYDNYSFVSNYSSLIPSSVSNVVPASNLYGKGQMTGCWQRASNGEGMLSILGYDEMGFVAKKSEIGLGRQMSISDYTNNTLGEVTQENFRKYKPATNGTMECIASGTIQNNYNYLHTNLLTSSVISITDKNGSMRTDTIQNLTYDNFGHVTTNDRGGTVADMTYGYDLMHGWLKSIKSGGKFDQKLYRETEGSTPCYNGNISAMTWRTANDYVRRFDYEYNEMNWLSQATFSYYSIGNPNSPSPTLSLIPYVGIDHEDYTSEYSYDKNGNLTAAYRQGLVGDLYDEDEYCVYDTMDDYNVEYYGNQRRSVNGSGQGTPSYYGSSSFVDGVEDGDDEYAYNANGAMTMDLNKGITNISYDLLNNIRQVTFSGNRNIVYTYAADGTRLRAVHSRKVGNTWLKDSTDYCGSLILQNGAPSMYQFAGGYISFSNSALSGCHYYIQDYLGNNRMVVNKTGAVEQTTHYYPYGGVIGGIDLNPGFQKYKFGGKELDRSYGLDWYDVQARQYDPVVPSWHTIDPLAEKYYYISPYAYCANNPVSCIDPDGKAVNLLAGGIGAIVGACINASVSYWEGKSSKEILGAAAEGAIVGGMVGLTLGATTTMSVYSIAGDAAASALNSGTGNAVNQFISQGEIKGDEVLYSSAVGIVSGAIGSLGGKLVNKFGDMAVGSINSETAKTIANAKDIAYKQVEQTGAKMGGKYAKQQVNKETSRIIVNAKSSASSEIKTTQIITKGKNWSVQMGIGGITGKVSEYFDSAREKIKSAFNMFF